VSVRIEVQYEGELHTSARHGPSGAVLETDAPKDNEGKGESFSPTDLLATALGTCMLTVMGILARRKGWELKGARVSVDKDMVADPVRRVGRRACASSCRPASPRTRASRSSAPRTPAPCTRASTPT
jgi:uncharacterized OsmC-like protein